MKYSSFEFYKESGKLLARVSSVGKILCIFKVPPSDEVGHLMTAAPELLASNEELVKIVKELCCTFNVPEPEAALQRSAHATAKARGD